MANILRLLPHIGRGAECELAHNETWKKPVTVTPPFDGKNMKLEFLLYNEKENNTPYHDLHLWINVSKEP
jgi:uncharacterized membrane protein